MRIGVFAYDFPHGRTYDGLMRLFLEGIKVDCIVAAPRVELTFYQSKIRIAPQDIEYPHPREVAKRLNIPYYVVPHNSGKCVDIIQKYNMELGVILGARILSRCVIDQFSIGILNTHPGLLPYNRGLDNIKWAIVCEIPQGVTCHLIDERIDWGSIILKRIVDVYNDDSLLDIHLRIWSYGLTCMVDAIRLIEDDSRPAVTARKGVYRKPLSPEDERELLNTFSRYKWEYASMTNEFTLWEHWDLNHTSNQE